MVAQLEAPRGTTPCRQTQGNKHSQPRLSPPPDLLCLQSHFFQSASLFSLQPRQGDPRHTDCCWTRDVYRDPSAWVRRGDLRGGAAVWRPRVSPGVAPPGHGHGLQSSRAGRRAGPPVLPASCTAATGPPSPSGGALGSKMLSTGTEEENNRTFYIQPFLLNFLFLCIFC